MYKMKYYISLIQLTNKFDKDVYDMFQRIGENENEFKNTANGLAGGCPRKRNGSMRQRIMERSIWIRRIRGGMMRRSIV